MANWLRVPTLQDPRPYAAALQLSFLIIGMNFLGFDRTLGQVAFICAACIAFDFALHILIKRKFLFPLSAMQTGFSLALLVNFGQGLWLALVPAFISIASKYVVTYKGRHIFNPSLFGLAVCVFLMSDLVSTTPAKQWNGSLWALVYVMAGATIFVMPKIKRSALVLSLLGFYGLQVLLRGLWLTPSIPLETIFYAQFFSPAFYLFTFFFITDPATTPNDPKKQVMMTGSIVLIDTLFHALHILSSVFYAGFIYFALRWLWLVLSDIRHEQHLKHKLRKMVYPVALPLVLGIVLVGGTYSVQKMLKAHLPHNLPVNFTFEAVQTGIEGFKGDALGQVDPRARHISKWLLAAGEGVYSADVNNDGLLDVFFTQTQKRGEDRAQLYLAVRPFVYEKFPLPQLQRYREDVKQNGVPAGAMFFDADNDGDKDLLILALSGKPMFLKNTLIENGALGFEEQPLPGASAEHQNAVAVTAADFDENGYLDVVWSNYFPKHHDSYDDKRLLNIFDLPKAEYEGDERPTHIMYNSWVEATNGGASTYLAGNAEGFADKGDIFNRSRWTLAMGAADLNNDTHQDIYFANDNGPDDLFMQKNDGKFMRLIGLNRQGVGRDTYKGMNVSFADFTKNGMQDIYVSNMHQTQLVEGSMLWLNNSQQGELSADAFVNSASNQGTWNEKRFGWGAGVGDLNLDGQPDIIQANGMIDSYYDGTPHCSSYWYATGIFSGAVATILPYASKWPTMENKCLFANERNRVYLNKDGFFEDVADKVGLGQPNTARAISLADLDNDGDLDLIVAHPTAPPSFYRNERLQPNDDWIGLKLMGNGKTCNADAVGTRVKASYGGAQNKTIEQRIYATQGMSAQGDHRLLFGLDGYVGMVKLEIDWCGTGKDISTAQLPSGRYTTLQQK